MSADNIWTTVAVAVLLVSLVVAMVVR